MLLLGKLGNILARRRLSLSSFSVDVGVRLLQPNIKRNHGVKLSGSIVLALVFSPVLSQVSVSPEVALTQICPFPATLPTPFPILSCPYFFFYFFAISLSELNLQFLKRRCKARKSELGGCVSLLYWLDFTSPFVLS